MSSVPRLFLTGLVFVLFATVAQAQECTHYASPGGPSIAQFFGQAYPGAVLCLQDGTYTGAHNMLSVPEGLSGTAEAPITVRAVNDGGAFIHGEYRYSTLYLGGGSHHWVFQGFDVGYSENIVVFLNNFGTAAPHHITIKRVCAFHANTNPRPGATQTNMHTWFLTGDGHLFEDICAAGWGRNSVIDDKLSNSVFRRVWARWEGGDDGHRQGARGWDWAPGGGPYQDDYSLGQTTGHNNIYENRIGIWSADLEEQYPPGGCNHGITWGTRTGLANAAWTSGPGNLFAGSLFYAYPGKTYTVCGGDGEAWGGNRWAPNRVKDLFMDVREYPQAGAISLGCELAGPSGDAPSGQEDCSRVSYDRITAWKAPGQSDGYGQENMTNYRSCTGGIENCPNLFTGQGGSGPGARLCGRYVNGTYTQEPLWPWPMDSRIKQALVRAGSQPLRGEAGPGYEAGTVTSEVVARYGPIPPDCQGTPVVVEPPMPPPRNLRAKLRE